jgi:hypothetical protein
LKEVGAGILRKHKSPVHEKLAKYCTWDSTLGQLAQSAAEYCLATETDTTHYGIAVDAYCHATSPIRRYADLMNQRILKQIIRGNREGLFVTVPIQDLNVRSKACKQYEKNLLFVRAVLNDIRNVSGARILDIQDTKLKIWVHQWQKSVTLYMNKNTDGNFISADEKTIYDLHEGDLVNLSFALNLAGRHWKERMIIRIL